MQEGLFYNSYLQFQGHSIYFERRYVKQVGPNENLCCGCFEFLKDLLIYDHLQLYKRSAHSLSCFGSLFRCLIMFIWCLMLCRLWWNVEFCTQCIYWKLWLTFCKTFFGNRYWRKCWLFWSDCLPLSTKGLLVFVKVFSNSFRCCLDGTKTNWNWRCIGSGCFLIIDKATLLECLIVVSKEDPSFQYSIRLCYQILVHGIVYLHLN